jgi:hypothetical protein
MTIKETLKTLLQDAVKEAAEETIEEILNEPGSDVVMTALKEALAVSVPPLKWGEPYQQFKDGPLTWQAFTPVGPALIIQERDGRYYARFPVSKKGIPHKSLEAAKIGAQETFAEAISKSIGVHE